jgi:prepilin-type N-terminal cleavage/methylation domain-containing protein
MTNLYKNRKKGFTLVEIIVVLVIIAILMAALAPVMIGWINEARESTVRAEARLYLTAAQTVVTEQRAIGITGWTAATEPSYATLITNEKFRLLVRDSNLAQIPPGANGTPPAATDGFGTHLFGFYFDAQGYPTAVRVRNVVRGGLTSANRLVIGTEPAGGAWRNP